MRLQAFLVASAVVQSASALTVPKLPPPVFTDTEISTNISITAWTEHTKTFGIVLALDATPSNNVQVAFGKDADADAILSDEETRLTLGWDCGAWFISSDALTNCFTAAPTGSNVQKEFSLQLRLGSDGVPRTLELMDGGAPLSFSGFDGESPPEWLFSTTWALLKVTARGVDAHNDHVSVKFGTDPFILLLK